MIIPVKKVLNNAAHIDAKLIDFSEICQKKSSEIGCFLLIVSWRSFPPRNFPWNWPIFLRTCPWKSFKIWLFSAKIPRNRPIYLRILTFSRKYPAKTADFSANFDFFPAKIPRNRPIFPRICPWKSRKIFLFFPRNISSPTSCKQLYANFC